MSLPSHRALASLGSAALGLLFVAMAGHPLGCAVDVKEEYQKLYQCAGDLDDNNPCTDDDCPGKVTRHITVADGVACTRGKNSGQCEQGVCKLPCLGMPSSCACETVADCPTATECTEWLCEAQHCKLHPKTGDAVKMQTAGDCKKTVCTADDKTTDEPDDTDKPAAMDGCHVGACVGGTPSQNPQTAGQPCGGGQVGFCDSAGDCAPCAEGTSKGCDAGELCYKTSGGQLACTKCNNGQHDADETGIDCGGICAIDKAGFGKKCDIGVKCSSKTDCTSDSCVDSVCCNTACGDPCKSCSGGSSGAGLCSDVPTGTMDATCGMDQVCVAGTMGKCFGRAGALCGQNQQCMSANCEKNKCAKGVAGTPCADNADCAIMPTALVCNSNHICG